MFDFDLLEDTESTATPPNVATVGHAGPDVCVNKSSIAPKNPPVRFWALSDVHTEHAANLRWLEGLSSSLYCRDTLLLAGDVAPRTDLFEQTLEVLKAKFARVFFVPGNHDLWVSSKDTGDSVTKLAELRAVCDRLGVETRPASVELGDGRQVLVVPIFAWYHASFDTEPDLEGWEGVQSSTLVSDYMMTRWPKPLSMENESVAELLDAENEAFPEAAECVGHAAVISFSHFLPRIELLPERRYMSFHNLMKVVGSRLLGERVAQLRPTCHVFGHTHYGWDGVIDGVRYMQGALGTPNERKKDPVRLSLCGFDVVADDCGPLLVMEGTTLPPPRRSSFSGFFERYGRTPDITSDIAPWACTSLSKVPGSRARVSLRGRAPPLLFATESKIASWSPVLVDMGAKLCASKVDEISPQELRRRLSGDKKQLIALDIRPPDEIAARGELPGTVPVMPLGELPLRGGNDAAITLFEALTDPDRLKVVISSSRSQSLDGNVISGLLMICFADPRGDDSYRWLQGGVDSWMLLGSLTARLKPP